MSTRYLKTLQTLLQRKSMINGPLKLDRPRSISKLLNNPYNNYKCIHVAGTNGKGSVSCKLSEILRSCGYKTGLTISPHISCVRERIQINNIMISENDFCNEIDEILQYETKETALSFFELLTILSFNYFAKQNVDYAVIEVGLGGRFDATNIIENPLLSVITSISLDHTAILGETTEEITKEKAGIIKPNSLVVIGPTVNKQIINDFVKDNKLLHIVDTNKRINNYDEENMLITKKCIDILSENNKSLKKNIDNIDIDNILLRTKPKCRFEVIDEYIIMDCAHNLRSMQELFKLLLQKYHPIQYDYRVIIGMSKGKNPDLCLKIVNKYAKYIHFVSISNINKRSLTINELNQCYLQNTENINKVIPTPSYIKYKDCNECNECNEIIKYALNECVTNNENKENKKQILIVCGSLYIMSNARQVFGCNDIIDPIDFSNTEFGQKKI